MNQTHPTKRLLVETVIRLLDTKPPAEITIDVVLAESNISRGSLYHHFEDFHQLLEAAHVNRYSGFVDNSISLMTQVVGTSKTRDELVENLRKITAITQAPELRANRFKRVQALAMASTFPRMEKLLALEQVRLTETIADLYREVVEKGWGNKDFSPIVAAVMIQTYTLGKVVDDFSPNPMDPDQWNELVSQILEKIFFPT